MSYSVSKAEAILYAAYFYNDVEQHWNWVTRTSTVLTRNLFVCFT